MSTGSRKTKLEEFVKLFDIPSGPNRNIKDRPTMKVVSENLDNPVPGPSGIQMISKTKQKQEKGKQHCRIQDGRVSRVNSDDPQPGPSGKSTSIKYSQTQKTEKLHYHIKDTEGTKISQNLNYSESGIYGIQKIEKVKQKEEELHYSIKENSCVSSRVLHNDPQPGPSGIQNMKFKQSQEKEKLYCNSKKDNRVSVKISKDLDNSKPGSSNVKITSKYKRSQKNDYYRTKKDTSVRMSKNLDDPQPGSSGIQTTKYKQRQEKEKLREHNKKDSRVTQNFNNVQPGPSGIQITSKYKSQEKDKFHQCMKKDSKLTTVIENIDNPQPGPSGTQKTKQKQSHGIEKVLYPIQDDRFSQIGCSRGKITKVDSKFFSDIDGFLEISKPTSDLLNYKITCDFMDPTTKERRTGEPFDQVPPHRWGTNVICGEGANAKMAHVTGPNKNYLFCSSPAAITSDDGESPGSYDEASCSIPSVPSVPSPDENVPASEFEDPETSPKVKNKFSKHTIPKSSTKRTGNGNTDPHNDSHVGEQTPHTRDKKEKNVKKPKNLPTVKKSVETVTMRVDGGFSPQPIRVRDIPLPGISWSDHTDLSLLMCFKEDIGLNERSSVVFRRNPNLNTRMRAILFDWLMEVCDVYKLRRVTYYLAIDYIDRYLSRTEIVPKNHLQLLGITCLFIAAKVEEIYPPKLAELAYVTDGACTDTDMLAKEMDILKELRWDVNPMTSTAWLCLYLQLACTKANEIRQMMRRLIQKDDDVIYPQFSPHLFMTASMLLDLCSLDDGMLQFKYSVIASSIIYYVLNREKALFVSGYTWENIRPCVEWMYPFAVVVFRTINIKPLVAPREITRAGSALRVSNPNIVLDEGHTVQNHVIDLKMLEDVYNEVKILRQNFKEGKHPEATGWTASEDGYDPACIAAINQRRRQKRKHLRTSTYAQASSRNQLRVHHTSNSDPQTSSESDNEPPKTEGLTTVAGITPLKNSDAASSSHRASSPIDVESPSHSYLRVRYIDEAGNKVSRTYITNNQSGLTEVEGSNLDLDEPSCSGEWRRQGLKRSRRDDSDLSSSENEGPPRKRSCSEKKCSCKSMLASPKCSGLYLQEGQRAGFGLRKTSPDPTVMPPAPPKPPVPENYEVNTS